MDLKGCFQDALSPMCLMASFRKVCNMGYCAPWIQNVSKCPKMLTCQLPQNFQELHFQIPILFLCKVATELLPPLSQPFFKNIVPFQINPPLIIIILLYHLFPCRILSGIRTNLIQLLRAFNEIIDRNVWHRERPVVNAQ